MRLIRFIFIILILLVGNKPIRSEEIYVEKWEDLPRYGLLAPDTHDIKSAKRLIVLAVQATPFFKGHWWRAHGLLGATRLPQEPVECLYTSLGYTSLFESYPTNTNSKMECVATGSEVGLIVLDELKAKSWVYQREHYLGLIGYELDSRFTYNENGNYGKTLTPLSKHRSVERIRKVLPGAYALYQNLKKQGFDDKTLGDAIGIALAFLERYGISRFEINSKGFFSLPFAQQIYQDTVTAIIQEMERGAPFFSALNIQMRLRDLSKDDIIGHPENEDQLNVIVKLIKSDLDYIEKISTMSNQNKRETPTLEKSE